MMGNVCKFNGRGSNETSSHDQHAIETTLAQLQAPIPEGNCKLPDTNVWNTYHASFMTQNMHLLSG